jgi:PTH1 family peptidyl-tRNA hydrolase
MKVIVGLGNPEIKYKNTRHNVGFMLADYISENSNKSKSQVFKSKNFMNDSGTFVVKVLKSANAKTEDLYVIHDDLDIKIGEFKIQLGKGPKDHNGLNDIYEKLGTNMFWHIRVGVDNRQPENRIRGIDYVLEDFTNEEKSSLEEVFKNICKALEI